MGFFEKLGVSPSLKPAIDWEITPAYTFTYFESWGTQRRIQSLSERYYYFFIDAFEEPAKLCLMERGIKFARVLAEISAPQEMIDRCVAAQGKTSGLDKSYAVDEALKQWLIKNVIDANDHSKVIPVLSGIEIEDPCIDLPDKDAPVPPLTTVKLRSAPQEFTEEEIPSLILKQDFFDSRYNPKGRFENYLVDDNDGLIVTDMVTGLMWQRSGIDIGSIRNMNDSVAQLNNDAFAGYSDWRLPTIEEGLSILEPTPNEKGLHLHSCFSKFQPFIFLADQRKPGGYWFVDFKQGHVFWASGFNPGGFGRVCRTV